MEVVALVVALIAATTAATMGYLYARTARAAEEQRKEMESRLGKSEDRRKKAEKKVEDASRKLKETERHLSEALARREEKDMAQTMLNLDLERAERRWRDVVLPEDAKPGAVVSTTGSRLAEAVAGEVDRLREEVGVSIRFSGALDIEMEAEAALGSLRIAEEILATVCKHADDVTVTVDEGPGPSASFSFVCEGWSGAVVLEGTTLGSNLEDMARRLDGWVRYERPSEDGLTVAVHLPASTPSPEVIDLEPAEAQPSS